MDTFKFKKRLKSKPKNPADNTTISPFYSSDQLVEKVYQNSLIQERLIIKNVADLDPLTVSHIAQLIIYNGFDCLAKPNGLDLMEYVQLNINKLSCFALTQSTLLKLNQNEENIRIIKTKRTLLTIGEVSQIHTHYPAGLYALQVFPHSPDEMKFRPFIYTVIVDHQKLRRSMQTFQLETLFYKQEFQNCKRAEISDSEVHQMLSRITLQVILQLSHLKVQRAVVRYMIQDLRSDYPFVWFLGIDELTYELQSHPSLM